MSEYLISDVYGYFIDRTAKAIKGDLNSRFRKLGINLTAEQWLILSKLSDKDGQSQVELGDKTYKNAPTVSRIIDLLCEKGFAERRTDAGDRRKFHIFITDKGRMTVEKVMPEVIEARKSGWAGLSHEDYESLIRIVDKVFDNLTSRR